MMSGMDTNSIIPAAVVSAVSVVNGAIASVRNARDIAKQSSDSALKEAVSKAYDAVQDLKDRVLDLDEENRQLKAKLAQKESISYDPQTQYFYKDREVLPLCPTCYQQAASQPVYLTILESGATKCSVCTGYFDRAPKGRTLQQQDSRPLRYVVSRGVDY